jgi:hypothetical protein
VLVPVLVYVNLDRFLVASPDGVPTTEERIALGGLQSSACARAGGSALVVVREPVRVLDRALGAYRYDRTVVSRAMPDAREAGDLGDFNCVVITRLKAPTAAEVGGEAVPCEVSCWQWAQETVGRATAEFGFSERDVVWTKTAHFEAVVLVREEQPQGRAGGGAVGRPPPAP